MLRPSVPFLWAVELQHSYALIMNINLQGRQGATCCYVEDTFNRARE